MVKLQWGRGLSTAEIYGKTHPRASHKTASMGPRSFDRGDSFTTRYGARKKVLQWGRGLSTAEITWAAMVLISLFKALQWGRGLSTAEISPVQENGKARLLASMGPRSFDRGDG